MQVKKSEAVAVFVGLGVPQAAGWTVPQLVKKINGPGGLAAYREKGFRFADPAVGAWFRGIDDAQDKGKLIGVVDDGAAVTPVPSPPPKSKAKAAPRPTGRPTKVAAKKAAPATAQFWRPDGRPTADAPLSVWREYRIDHPAEMTAGSNVKAVYDALVKAGAGKNPKPLTKADLMAVLREKCPDRDAAKMETNLNNLIPTRFRNVYRVFVWSAPTAGGQRGYYVVNGGKLPQPKAGKEKSR